MFMYETDRLGLRPFEESDMSGAYKDWWTDPEVTRYNSHGLFPQNNKQKKQFLSAIEAGSMIVLAIIVENHQPPGTNLGPLATRLLKESRVELPYKLSKHKHIGNVSLQSINWINRSAEYAVIMGDKSYWGKGYATEASRILLEHGFKKLGLHRIWTGTAASNIGMKHVAEKLGMQREGIFRDGMFLDGQWVDVVAYGILREEFENGK